MKKSVIIISGVLLGLILLLFIIPFAFKGKIKNLVVNEANKSLNATVGVGKISISLLKNFPSVYIGLNDLLITGKQEFEGDTLVSIEEISVTTSILNLIGGSPYEIRKIWIDKADIGLKVLADGKANWDIVKSTESGQAEEETSGTGNFRLLLKSLLINDSRLVYDDRELATYLVFEGLNHSLSGDLTADFTTLETITTIESAFLNYEGIDYLDNANIGLAANIDADLKKSIYTLRTNTLTVNGFSVVFNGTAGLPEDGYDLHLGFSTPNNTFKDLLSLVPAVYSRDFNTINTEGIVSFDGEINGLYTDDAYPAFRIGLEVKDAWFRYPDLPAGVEDININAMIENPGGDLDLTVVDLKKFSLRMAGNPVSGRFLLKNPISDPYIDTRIEAAINLADIGKFYPLEAGETLNGRIDADITLKGLLSDVEDEKYDRFEASGSFSTSGITYTTSALACPVKIVSAALSINPSSLAITDLRLQAGQSDFNLKGKLENYLAYYLKDETLLGNFDLRSSMVDVNELLAFSGTETETETSDTSAISAFIVPEGLDLSLNVSASRLLYQGYDMSNLKGLVRIRDQKLTLENLSMNGLGGTLQMTGSYSSEDPVNPAIDFNLGMKSISIPETFRQVSLVTKFAPILEKVIGDFSGNFKLSGLLDQAMMPRLETLAGLGDLSTSELKVSNVNTLNQLSSSLKMDQLKELKVAGTRLIVEFLDGAMEVKPFEFKALGIDMGLQGRTALDQKIGYQLDMKIPRILMGGSANAVVDDLVAKAGQAGADVQLSEYINVDAIIDGTITDPKVRLNLAGTGKDIVQSVKDQVQEQVEQEVEEIKKDISAEAGKYIEEADRQAQAILDEAQKQSDEIMKQARLLADDTKKQAALNAEKIVNEAKGKGYVAELAAKKSSEEVIKQGDKQAQNILGEAQKKSDAVMEKARQEAEKIKAEARSKTGN
jgi:cell division septum initiation protein DivIVA